VTEAGRGNQRADRRDAPVGHIQTGRTIVVSPYAVERDGTSADKAGMNNSVVSLVTLLIAGLALGFYILRRRSRQGRRTPKF